MKKILIIQSDKVTDSFYTILNHLNNDFFVTLFTSDKKIKKEIPDIDTRYRRSISQPKTFADWLFFTLALPFLWLFLIIRLLNFRIKKYKTLLLTDTVEKITITPWAKLFGYKVIWLDEFFLPKSFKINLYSLFFKWWSSFANHHIVVSQAVQNHLLKNYKVTNTKVIPHYIDLEEIQQQTDIYRSMVQKEYQIHNEALFIIGFIGKLDQVYGVEYILKSVEHFKELIPDFQIIIVGDGPAKKQLIWLSKMLHLENNVRFVGKQEHTQRWYNYFNVFVYPRIEDTEFAQEVAEAMAAKIPVVAFETDGVKEIVNGQGGILVRKQNAEDLSQAIFDLYNSQELHQKFAQQAQKRIENIYSKEVIVNKWKDILNNA